MFDKLFYVLRDDLEPDELFELLETYRDVVKSLRKDPIDIIMELYSEIDRLKTKLLEDDYCPDCGHKMEYRSSGHQNYVPYGSTCVCESEDEELYCPNCGYVVD